MAESVMAIGTVITPIVLFILSGYYASNATWCTRKMLVSVSIGLLLGAYAIFSGVLVSNDWLQVAYNSAPVLGAMYLIDRIIKGAAKRYGIEWLYTDECPIEE